MFSRERIASARRVREKTFHADKKGSRRGDD
jgi:hypothetical protein